MCATVRATGCPAPVVWNLNWPRMINGHEDIFQAAADSAVDGVSFCCYPGQSDVANPFWANPADLSVNNYLQAVLLPLKGPGIRFRAGPGQYRLTRGSSGHP